MHEDRVVLAFMDHQPVTEGHLLVVPKVHATGLVDLDEEIGVEMWRVAHRLARALRQSGLRCEGVTLSLADGEAAGQDVFHVHLHVFPRFEGDGYRIVAQSHRRNRDALDTAAAAVRAGLSVLAALPSGQR